MISRRGFVLGSVGAVGSLAGGCRLFPGTAVGETDPDLSVFISDLHVAAGGIKTKYGEQPAAQNQVLSGLVDEILRLRPRPRRIVAFGDIALWFGYDADYDVAKSILDRITAAGIDLYVTTGNHDHREPLFAHFPQQRERTPVPGRTVSVIDLGHADLLLLDTLDEKPESKPGDDNRVGGAMDDAQYAWLQREAPIRPRPFFCGAHHSPTDLNGRKVWEFLCDTKHFAGWIQGHEHQFAETWIPSNWSCPRIRRVVILPSAGWWGDIGYALFRTYADRAVYSLVERDFYFPRIPQPGTPRPPEWEIIRREHEGREVTLRYID